MAGNFEDLTRKDFPWAERYVEQGKKLPLAQGVQAVIPELDERGEPTGEFVTVSNEHYVRAMGEYAYKQPPFDGNPEEVKRRLDERGVTAMLAAAYPELKPLTLEGMKK